MTPGGSSADETTDVRLCRQRAADELARKLEQLAAQLATTARPDRVRFGRSGPSFLRPRSPRGFVISRHDLEVLLPDGRVWVEGLPGPDGRPSGRYRDVREAARRGVSSRITAGGAEFAYLGLTLGGYAFGVTNHGSQCRPCAMVTTGQAVTLIDVDEALAAIARKAGGGDRPD